MFYLNGIPNTPTTILWFDNQVSGFERWVVPKLASRIGLLLGSDIRGLLTLGDGSISIHVSIGA